MLLLKHEMQEDNGFIIVKNNHSIINHNKITMDGQELFFIIIKSSSGSPLVLQIKYNKEEHLYKLGIYP